MDKNKIKLFAIWARRSLIAQVSEKANRIGIYEDRIVKAIEVQGGFKLEGNDDIFSLSKSDRDALIRQINEKSFQQVMEEVAYTWFNRFMGLRYMEVNDYLPSGVRILSSKVEGKNEPDVLTKVSEIIDELELNADEIYDLLDTGNNLDREKAYRIILVKQCNELGKIIPQMFEKISDYTELLLPDNLLEEGSVIRKMVEDIEESDWLEEVEIIGWMYQYYISEKKDEVFAALKKNVKITKENIPAATQLFTPKWIVKYMVENSLGRLWLEGHPNEELQSKWKYYLEEAEQELEVEKELEKIREEHSKLTPEDIKVLDPCMGSGHILVYAFDVLYEIYKSVGYSEREIPRMILQNNLYGLDIDDRAAQLASFALIMKARHYNRRLFREIECEHLELNLCAIQESNEINQEVIEYFCSGQSVVDSEQLRKDVKYLVEVFTDAKEYGSILEIKKVNFDIIKQRLKEVEDEDNLTFRDYRKIIFNYLTGLVKQGEIMSRLYEICITNPPYIGNKGINDKLKNLIVNNYAQYKMDIFSVFIVRISGYVSENGHIGLMTPYVWMFISAYEELRKLLIKNRNIITLVQLEYSGFTEATVPVCSFTMRNCYINQKGEYIKLSDFRGEEQQSIKTLEAVNDRKCGYRYSVSQSSFTNIPSQTISFWVNTKIINKYGKNKNIKDISEYSGAQNKTADNEKYLRKYWEIDINKLGSKWIKIAKGGPFRRWYGNIEEVIDWSNEARSFYKNNKTSCIMGEKYLFREGICWTKVTSYSNPAFRYVDKYTLYETAAPTIHVKDTKYVIGLLNSVVGKTYIQVTKQTLNYQVFDIINVPIIIDNSQKQEIEKIVLQLINLYKNDWNEKETSIDFEGNNLLIQHGNSNLIRIALDKEIERTNERFRLCKSIEEELNKIFIKIYNLEDKLNCEVDDKDITIRKAERERDIKSFISYAVGCMFGRYSIDAEGVVYAGGDFNDKWNFESNKVRKIEKDDEGNIISDSWVDSRFMPDKENVIPITEDDYFEDDIVSRFVDFVKTVYGNDTLEENLDFIADSIGRKSSETSRQAIRRYFVKDFYKDHLKVYQKRPIYWMFESGKNDGFKCLVYMHRYNEQTIAKVRTDYLHILQRKYESEINRLQLVVDSEEYTAKDRTTAKRKMDRISKQIEECREYDQVVAYLANEKIFIDLDDGVKINYTKFQNINVINSKGKEVKMNLLEKI